MLYHCLSMHQSRSREEKSLLNCRYLRSEQGRSQNVMTPTYENTEAGFVVLKAETANSPNTYESLGNNRDTERDYSGKTYKNTYSVLCSIIIIIYKVM